MSLLPLPNQPNTPVPSELVLLIENLDQASITANQIAAWTKNDPVLSKVMQYLMMGWSSAGEGELKPYWNRRIKLSVHADCILWGMHVVVLSQGHGAILAELHEAHPGMLKMKALACHLVWWPNLDQELEDIVKHCENVSKEEQIHLQLHFIHGSGLHILGLGYTSTLLGP